MKDLAWQLLQPALQQQGNGQALWLVDENITEQDIASITPAKNLQVISNRYDVYLALQKKGFKAALSDYDFSGFELSSFDVIYYRVSKEKAVVHHIINAAARYLKPQGELLLAGYKNEGIKTYVSKAAALLGCPADKQRGPQSTLLATLTREAIAADPLDDKNYTEFSTVVAGDLSFISKPGIFGWNKVDQGSVFLIDTLANYLGIFETLPEQVIDLGCGYGFLSVMAHQFLSADYLATDNNITAINACKQNFAKHKLSGEVLIDNCAEAISKQADLIICNPPFHQGFDIEGDLTRRFLQTCKRLLAPGGRGLFVVNSFIPLEKKAAPLFSSVETVASNKSFKVIALAL
ncbi:MAG: class I SAM-dependent methyltransferase [Oceanicoccus sp.]|uniref:methyltransferase n=1 Tax=Oceanicoccus sp. TaxID=2691044 RepID=UPI0026042E65|nr:methyltransferase [Oceanicoccus sp.]MCP3907604.1 class I SAM-dependent methyltransferase [Oceanicoccus sp.]MDG1773610.1 methyltransferase [Oceanicoccus sp.]